MRDTIPHTKKSRILKKGLDKYRKVWYNDYSQEGNLDSESHQGQWKQTRSELKPKGYTNPSSPHRAWQSDCVVRVDLGLGQQQG